MGGGGVGVGGNDDDDDGDDDGAGDGDDGIVATIEESSLIASSRFVISWSVTRGGIKSWENGDGDGSDGAGFDMSRKMNEY